MDNFCIRRATPADAAAIATLAARLFPLGCPQTAPADLAAYISAELTPARFLTLLDDPNIIVLLAEADARLVAYMLVARYSPQPQLALAEAAEFRKLYVDPAWHGRGVAAELMQRAFELLADEPCPVWLTVFSENPRAIAFYRRLGFEIAGEQIFIVGTDPQRDFLMLRPAEQATAQRG